MITLICLLSIQVTLTDKVIRTVYQSTCSLLRKNDLFLIRFGETNDFKTLKPVALLDILKFGNLYQILIHARKAN